MSLHAPTSFARRGWRAARSGLLAVLMAAVAGAVLLPAEAEARRLGGGGAAGMKRTLPQRTPDTPPAQPATPAGTQATPGQTAAAPAAGATAGAAAAAAPRRSWMGPIAGIAAGLGIAALMHHLGLGAAFGNFLVLLLLGVVALVAIRWLMRRFAGSAVRDGLALQGAGASAASKDWPVRSGTAGLPRSAEFGPPGAMPLQGLAAAAGSAPAGGTSVPAGFDAAGFERLAKTIFIRMQTANDRGDVDDLKRFTTPELFASLRLDLQERGQAPQNTDVLKVEAEVLDVALEGTDQIVSVRFSGLIREEREAAASDFDEVWHLVQPQDASRPWAIAGIQQTH